MEVQGVEKIYNRSVDFGARYKYYPGDGDSKAFSSIAATQPYGPECPLGKLEYVGHIQKLIGSRLKKF